MLKIPYSVDEYLTLAKSKRDAARNKSQAQQNATRVAKGLVLESKAEHNAAVERVKRRTLQVGADGHITGAEDVQLYWAFQGKKQTTFRAPEGFMGQGPRKPPKATDAAAVQAANIPQSAPRYASERGGVQPRPKHHADINATAKVWGCTQNPIKAGYKDRKDRPVVAIKVTNGRDYEERLTRPQGLSGDPVVIHG